MMNFFYAVNCASLPRDLEPLSLVIGNFDGIHRGHQELIKTSLAWSKAHGGNSVVLTFDPHPFAFLNPQLQHSRLFPLTDQREQLQASGLRGAFVQAFNEEFRKLTAEEFLQDFIMKHFHPKHLVVGHDFGFGKNRSGNIETLKKFSQRQGIDLQIVPAFKILEEVVSTSKIREFLSQGDVHRAETFLGRPYHLSGVVVHGAHRGASIGFPTANLQVELNLVSLRRGVYCTKTVLPEGIFTSVTNVGLNPTVSQDNSTKIETHIFGVSRSLYQETLQVRFYEFLREEKKFSSLDELKSQIQIDANRAKEFFQ